MLLKDRVAVTMTDQGVINEPILKVITNDMALLISYCLDSKLLIPDMAKKVYKMIFLARCGIGSPKKDISRN